MLRYGNLHLEFNWGNSELYAVGAASISEYGKNIIAYLRDLYRACGFARAPKITIGRVGS